MRAIYDDNSILINLNELVRVRSEFLKQSMSDNQADYIAEQLRRTLTWDTLYHMVDEAILEFFDLHESPYGQISPPKGWEAELVRREKNAAQFELVYLEGNGWTIKVPRRKK